MFLRQGVWMDVHEVLRERSEDFSFGHSGFDVPMCIQEKIFSGCLCL